MVDELGCVHPERRQPCGGEMQPGGIQPVEGSAHPGEHDPIDATGVQLTGKRLKRSEIGFLERQAKRIRLAEDIGEIWVHCEFFQASGMPERG